MKKIVISTGGGDAPGLNAVIYAVVKAANMRGWEVYGSRSGYKGLLDLDELVRLPPEKVEDITPTGGTILGSTNKGNPFAMPVENLAGEYQICDVSDRVMENFKRMGFYCHIAVGGDGSLEIAHRFAKKGMPVIGVPKTIDNDLEATHLSFGFDTAVSTATEALDKLHSTAKSHDRVMVVEVMGRESGWIALNSGISGGTQLAALPSKVLDKDDFLNLLITQLQNQDPLNPTDSVEFTAQLAQFSSLEQLGNVNDNLQELKNFQASINNSQAVSLIGKTITANGNFIRLTSDMPVECRFELDDDAALVVANVYDSTGEFVKAIESQNMAAGEHTLLWDGTDRNGNRMPGGDYTFEIMAADLNGKNVDAGTFFTGIVDKVTFENNTSFLVSDGRKIALGDVIQVAAPEKAAVIDTADSDSINPASQSTTPSINGGN